MADVLIGSPRFTQGRLVKRRTATGRKVPSSDDGSRLGADISSSTSNSGRLLSGVTQDTLSSAFFSLRLRLPLRVAIVCSVMPFPMTVRT